MQISSDNEVLSGISFLTGDKESLVKAASVKPKSPFCEEIIDFLDELSKEIIRDKDAKQYPDVITFGFWIRKASLNEMKNHFVGNKAESKQLGKGFVFHVAPSNVPVNYAYSLVTGLLTGNANVVRVPSKDFPQVRIINDAINRVLECHMDLVPYVLCVRYERSSSINDFLSSMSDMRIIWGGDKTIEELRKSPLPPRSGEITFADRYSLAIVDSDYYMAIENKKKVAEDFYNDTFLTDQNACTSPRVIIWVGNQIDEAKRIFWDEEHKVVLSKYNYQSIQGVNKLTKAYIVSAAKNDVKIEEHEDNYIYRVRVKHLDEDLMEYRDNSGFFYEYDCKDILEIAPLCTDKKCQTVAYIGNADICDPVIEAGVKGIDRIVPIGKTMDFELIWDGYNLVDMLTRRITKK